MGVWIRLKDENGIVTVPHFEDGATHPLGGTCEADVSVTYNYSAIYKLLWPDFPGIVDFFDGKQAKELIPKLSEAVEKLGTRKWDYGAPNDYWAATPGNAGAFMALVLSWAELHPDAVFRANG